MTASVMQPYLFPYLGYFQLMNASDVFIAYDDVQYINRGWINRNRILMNGEGYMFTFSLKNDSSRKNINERYFTDRFNEQFEKFEKTLKISYGKAPYFDETTELVVNVKEEMIASRNSNIAVKIYRSLILIAQHLDLEIKFHLSSEITKGNELAGQERIIVLCNKVGANKYVNLSGGKHLYEERIFEEAGISLFFLEPEFSPYNQFDNKFVGRLSIIDALMFKGKDSVQDNLLNYKLTQ